MNLLRSLAACVPAALLSLASAGAAPAAQPPSGDALRQIIEEGDPGLSGGRLATPTDRERLDRLYQGNGYRMLWSSGGKLTPAASALLDQLRLAADRALTPEDYDTAPLSAAAQALGSPAAGPGQWALFDARLSIAGLRFASDLHFGRVDPASVGHNLTVERGSLDIPAALARLAASQNVPAELDALEPPFTHYALLKKELAHYRALAAEDGLNSLPRPAGKSLKPGEAYTGAAQLQRLLIALGDLTAATAGEPAPHTLTPALAEGLQRFQARHGEKADGALGAATFAELTRPLSARVRQIELTMERWRWLPAVSSAPIIVNIPQFRLYAFETTADSEAHIRQMDVIVGKSFDKTQTPVFAADMSYVVFRPYWEVPYSIAVKEIVPAARKNPNYIETHQMEIVRGAGDSAPIMPSTPENIELVARGTLRVRQKPGPDNSLGLVKFMLPNPYNVYLHSTPAQALFSQSRRDFSHGCVRVVDPVGLAEYVLRDRPEWTRDKILAAMNGGKPQTVTLKKKIRVLIVYGTAIAREQGDILFFDDIYGHDRRLEKALEAHRPAGTTDGARPPLASPSRS
ncbi:MAG TPA: L,D-transpeptidase family protein [Steroidobacteraceae bacterium]|jgi:murein L,D-transpeptidase YcbB/YkuD|nr:L,D-transpeptidase family protein [Steroidobacteraceae bacterium]